ncbi:hypothetical protein ILUMI_01719, partial [Ignelater luminosus]
TNTILVPMEQTTPREGNSVDNNLRSVESQKDKSEEEEQNTGYTLRKRKDLQPPIHLKDFELNLVEIEMMKL